MSLARLSMTNRVDVQRDANYSGSADTWGNDSPANWQAHLTSLPCRFWFDGVQTVVDGIKSTEVTTRKLIVPAGTDITEDDRIVSVKNRLGVELADGPMRIDSVGHRSGHIVLTLVDVR